MELSWLSKLRITVVMALGAMVIGVGCWSMAAPDDPMGIVRLSNLSFVQGLFLSVLALGLGFVGYFLGWPYGSEIGLLAVPSGLAIWGLRSGTISRLMAATATLDQRHALLNGLRWESLYWLALVFMGVAGVRIARRRCPQPELPILKALPSFKAPNRLHYATGLLASLVIGYFLTCAFTEDIRLSSQAAVCQPPARQIVFGLIAAFGFTAFAAKTGFHLSYLWPMVTTGLMFPVSTAINGRASDGMTTHAYPASCLPSAVLTALPIQIVAFGSIGAILGYWAAIRCRYWRLNELH